MLLGHVVRICNPFVENSSPYLITLSNHHFWSEWIFKPGLNQGHPDTHEEELTDESETIFSVDYVHNGENCLAFVCGAKHGDFPHTCGRSAYANGSFESTSAGRLHLQRPSIHLLLYCHCTLFLFLHSMFVIVSCHQSLFIQSFQIQLSVFLLFFFLHRCLSSFSLSFHV